MSTIKVMTMKHDIIFGQQLDTVAISVPVSEINYKNNNETKKNAQRHANEVITNRLHRAKETKIIPTGTNINNDKSEPTPTVNGKYTDSDQITSARKARESKKRAIQSARKNQREQKITLQNIHNVEMSETPRLPTIELKPIVPLCALEEWFANKR